MTTRTLALLALLAAAPAHADGVIDSMAACSDLQKSTLRVTCAVQGLDDGTPMFWFGFDQDSDADQVALAALRVITPACLVREIVVVMHSITHRVTKAAACTPGTGLGDFQTIGGVQ